MGLFEESVASYYEEVKRGGVFGKKYTVSALLYKHRMRGHAFKLIAGEIEPTSYEIPYEKIVSIETEIVEGKSCLVVEYKQELLSISSRYGRMKIAFWGLSNAGKLGWKLNMLWKECLDEIEAKAERERQARAEEAERERQRENAALTFYQNCYNFHVKEDTPVYTFQTGKNEIIALFIAPDKSMNFMQINGYREEESVGTIPYNNIHYYERAGNVSYATDIHGKYSSYGGSFTGARFSKTAAAIGHLMFGYMGMVAGALYSHKPTQMTPSQSSFNLDSEIVKIDDRNVVLNFFSDQKKQYVDIELPQDIYNFLQTYLPDKKYGIVEELERQAAVRKNQCALVPGSGIHLAPPETMGTGTVTPAEDLLATFKVKVNKLKLMKEAGLLSEAEFEEERQKLLAQL